MRNPPCTAREAERISRKIAWSPASGKVPRSSRESRSKRSRSRAASSAASPASRLRAPMAAATSARSARRRTSSRSTRSMWPRRSERSATGPRLPPGPRGALEGADLLRGERARLPGEERLEPDGPEADPLEAFHVQPRRARQKTHLALLPLGDLDQELPLAVLRPLE